MTKNIPRKEHALFCKLCGRSSGPTSLGMSHNNLASRGGGLTNLYELFK